MVITPYPWGNAAFENPSVLTNPTRDVWVVPDGVQNPVQKPNGGGYLSDPDLQWLPDIHEFWLYYRQVKEQNIILLTRSSDGVRWSEPVTVLRVPNHLAVSPTVVRRAPNAWMMWTVNSGTVGCSGPNTVVELRTSTDGIVWSAPSPVSIPQGDVSPWHIDVQWIPALGQYWAMFNGKTPGSCTTSALYLATSSDGTTWQTYRSPVLTRGSIPELNDVVYRGTFAYDPQRDLVSIWHSGARSTNGGYEWHAAFERRRRTDLFDAIGQAQAAVVAPSNAPPLTNATAP
jgi:hypothetical protein